MKAPQPTWPPSARPKCWRARKGGMDTAAKCFAVHATAGRHQRFRNTQRTAPVNHLRVPLNPGFSLLCILASLVVNLPSISAAEPTPAQKLVWNDGILVVAHRGNSSEAPENTLPSFQSAL